MTVVRLALAIFALLPGVAIATENRFSFSQELGRPVSISYFQPVPGLQREIAKIDENGDIEAETRWRPFYESDVWVFFLKNGQDIEIMPVELIEFLRRERSFPEKAFSRYEITFPDGSKKLLLIAMMEPFLKYDLGSYRCELAYLVKWAISSPPQEKEAPMSCPRAPL